MAQPKRAFELEAADVRRMAKGNWGKIYRALASQLEPALMAAEQGKKLGHTCPVHGTNHQNGKGDGFRFFPHELGPNGNGGAICNTCTDNLGDGFRVLQWLYRWTFPETLAQVYTTLGGRIEELASPNTQVETRPVSVAACHQAVPSPDPMFDLDEARKCLTRLREADLASVALSHPTARPAIAYFRAIGLSLDELPDDVRLHPRMRYYDQEQEKVTGMYPTLLAVLRDSDGRPVSLHRTYLSTSGRKAPVPTPKKLMPCLPYRRSQGGAIRLFPLNGKRLHVAEGIETALAVREILGTREPVWSLYSSTLMEMFEPPEGIDDLIIWADKDRKHGGEVSAQELMARSCEHGIRSRVIIPPIPIPPKKKGVDFRDLRQEYPVEVIRASTWYKSLLRTWLKPLCPA